MYNYKTKSYSWSKEKFKGEKIYSKESVYYLRYNSQKALYAMNQLMKEYSGTLQEKCFYYHVYLDLLFEAVGMIINRFKPHRKQGNIFLQSKNNCEEYGYNQANYPLLNDKSFRNFIEHIDERAEFLIDSGKFFGTFNVIFEGMDINIEKELLNDNKKQNNLLNLKNKTYTILDVEKNQNVYNVVEKNIDLIKLKDEIKRINEISNMIYKLILIE